MTGGGDRLDCRKGLSEKPSHLKQTRAVIEHNPLRLAEL